MTSLLNQLNEAKAFCDVARQKMEGLEAEVMTVQVHLAEAREDFELAEERQAFGINRAVFEVQVELGALRSERTSYCKDSKNMQESSLERERWEAQLECREQATHPSGVQQGQQGRAGAALEAQGHSE